MSRPLPVAEYFDIADWSNVLIKNQQQIINLILRENTRLRSENEGLPIGLKRLQYNTIAEKKRVLWLSLVQHLLRKANPYKRGCVDG